MEIESHVLPVKLRLLMKNQKYAIRLLKIAENNPICQRIPNTYSIKFENIGFDTSLWNNKYAKWKEDEKQTNKRHPSQLISVLDSVSVIVHKTDKVEQINNFIKPHGSGRVKSNFKSKTQKKQQNQVIILFFIYSLSVFNLRL